MAWHQLLLSFLLMRMYIHQARADTLQVVDDQELTKLIKDEQYVVALFCTDANKAKCEEYEGELAAMREDFIDALSGDAWIVMAKNSGKVVEYTQVVSEPVIVMFRSSIPVLYDGPANEEVMLETLLQYREPAVKELTDTSFEHLTQASSGATTGDWLVLFYNDECEQCHRMTAALESVACKVKGRMNVAKVNKQTHGEVTGRRFELGLEANPNLIFFRLGKMYRYKLDKYDPQSLHSFMTGFYKNYPAESIPLPKTPFDDFVQLCVDYIKEYPLMAGLCVAVPVLMLLGFMVLMRSEEEKPKKSKKKKKDKEGKDKQS